MAITGILLLFLFFKRLPEPWVPAPDLSPLQARVGLFVIIAVAAFLRLADFLEPPSMYWTDHSITSIDGRAILDFNQHFLLFPVGQRPPIYQYFVSLVFLLLPGVKTFAAQNIAFALMDLIGLGVFYLLGKEVGGRRAGILLVAWGAVSKPLLVLCMIQMPCLTGHIALAAALLFTFRVLNKPDARHFALWGIVLALGAYGYQSHRPYLAFLPLVLLAGLWFQKDGVTMRTLEKVLAVMTLLVWLFFFLQFNRFLPGSGRGSLAGMVAMTGFFYFMARIAIPPDGKVGALTRWMGAMFLAGVLMFPIVSDPRFPLHVNEVSILHQGGALRLDGQVMHTLWIQFGNTLSTLFLSGWDHPYVSYPGETFFEFASLPLIVAGLVFLAARPDRTKIILLVCAVVGLSPHVLSGDPHSGKLQGVVAPLSVLGVLAVEKVLGILRDPKGRLRTFAWVLLALYGVGAGTVMFHRFYVFLPTRLTPDRTLYELAKADRDAGRKVFIYGTTRFHNQAYAAGILCQGMDVDFLRHEYRRIWLTEGIAVPDVAVYLQGQDVEAIQQLKEEYAGATWEGHRNSLQDDPAEPPVIMRVLIPAGLIPRSGADRTQDPWISVRYAPPSHWKRKVYIAGAGMDEGFIYHEDRAVRLGEGFSVDVSGLTARFDGTLYVPRSGEYRFDYESANYVLLDVDGKKRIDERPRRGRVAKGSVTLNLEQGEYPVRLRTFFWNGAEIPKLLVTGPDGIAKDL